VEKLIRRILREETDTWSFKREHLPGQDEKLPRIIEKYLSTSTSIPPHYDLVVFPLTKPSGEYWHTDDGRPTYAIAIMVKSDEYTKFIGPKEKLQNEIKKDVETMFNVDVFFVTVTDRSQTKLD
jgi:hypothetical protein